MKEADVKKGLVDQIRLEGGYARRIEDRFSVGMPDTVFIPKGLPVIWVEVKIVDWNLLKPSARQYIELKRLNLPPHSRAFVLGWKAGDIFIHPPVPGVPILECLTLRKGEALTEFFGRAVQQVEWNYEQAV